MISRLSKLQGHENKRALVSKINEVVERLNVSSAIKLSGRGRINKTPFGTTLHLPKDSTVKESWAMVVSRPSYPDPTANPVTSSYAGRTYYTLRLIGESFNVYNNNINYTVGDSVSYPDEDSPLYTLTTETTEAGHKPEETQFWSEAEELRVDHAIGHESTEFITKTVRDCVPWYEPKEIVPIVSRVVDDKTRYFINLAMFWTGTEQEASLRYNEAQQRTMAVFA